MTEKPNRSWIAALSLLWLACGSSSPAPVPSQGVDAAPDTSMTLVEPDAATPASDVPPPGGETAAGTPIGDPAARGTGACAARTLAEVIAAVHRQRPDLADIKVLQASNPDPSLSDGSLIRAFAHQGGFRLVFKRGDGDCPSGCIDNWYWYFQTDAACEPALAGQYSRVYRSPGNCFEVAGTILWGIPGPTDPSVICGADNRPQNISGTYQLQGTGSRTECTAKGGGEPTVMVSLGLQVTVVQNAADLASGMATVVGTGNPRIDGVPLPATFTRRRLTAHREVSNLPAMCVDQHDTTLELDLETAPTGKLSFTELRSLGCPPGQEYCKGQLSLQLAGK